MRQPFEPIADRPRWRILYEDVLQSAEIDQVVTYVELASVLDTDSRPAIQDAMRRAARELEEQDLRAIENVPRVGYRIVKPQEHLTLARKHQRKSSRALLRGNSKVVHVDMSAVPPEFRQAFEMVGRAFSIQMEVNRRLSVGHRQLQKAIADIDERLDSATKRTDAEVAELRARLAALEQRQGE